MTNFNHAPHGADGKLDPHKLSESMDHGKKMVVEGKELMLDAYQVEPGGTVPALPNDGSYFTIYHHVPADKASPAHKSKAMKVPPGLA